MTWFAAFRCLECEHFWREPSPEDAWEMATQVAAAAVCPLCGAQMREGRVELLSHVELNPALLDSISYIFLPADNSSQEKPKADKFPAKGGREKGEGSITEHNNNKKSRKSYKNIPAYNFLSLNYNQL